MQTIQNNMQDNAPLVSFVVTAYNLPQEMLRECLGSIVALSLRRDEREVIVVDDGSDAFAINDLADYDRDIVYVRVPNGGVSVARNIGLRMATGQFVQFVDGDDMLLRAPYEHCLDILRYNGADMVMFDFTRQPDASGDLFGEATMVSGAEYMRSHNIRGASWSYLFRRTMLGSLRFTPGRCYGEDEEFTPQLLLRAEKVCDTGVKAYYYRPRSQSALGKDDVRSRLQRLDDNVQVICRLLSVADSLPVAEKAAMYRRVAQLTMDYIYNVIVTTRSVSHVEKRLEKLRSKGLFPLPDKDYTRKYRWFRRMTSSRLGLRMLVATLPLMKKER